MSDPASQVVARVDAVVRRDARGQFTLTLPDGWRAVPQEGASHLSREHIERFALAFRSLGVKDLHAVGLELRGEIEIVQRFDASEAGLGAFNRACAHFNCALTTAACTALVICATDDYQVVCGPEDFIRMAVGTSPETALANFQRYAADPSWTPSVRAMFEAVHRALASGGTRLVFP